jgi:diguanylate cyclase (GGDEF)-like protein/PAS domain S-box-containing protein
MATHQLITRRLKRLADTAHDSFADGQIDNKGLAQLTNLAGRNDDEISRLTGTFAEVLGAVSQHQETLAIAALVVANSDDSIIITDSSKRILNVNPATTRIYGYDTADLIGSTLGMFRTPEQGEDFYTRVWAQIAATGEWHGEALNRHKNGGLVATWHYITALYDASGQVTHFIFVSTDLSERKEAEKTLSDLSGKVHRHQESLRLFGQMIDQTDDSIVILDSHRHIVDYNPATCKIYGYDTVELIGKGLTIFRSSRHDTRFYDEVWREVFHSGQWQGESWHAKKGGGEVFTRYRISTLRDDAGAPSHFIVTSTDLTEQKAAEEAAQRLTEIDALTGLANRRVSWELLQSMVAKALLDHREMTVALLNVDQLSTINQSFGADVGDALLKEIAVRMGAIREKGELHGYPGQGEFSLIFTRSGKEAAIPRIQAYLSALCGAYWVNGRRVDVSVTAGVSLFPHDAQTPEGVSTSMSAALRFAKQSGERGGFCFFSPEMTALAHARFVIENDLKKALAADDQLFLLYQPQVDLESQRVVGVEALIRWQHPVQGLMSPAQFIPVAEESTLILDIGDWVLKEAARQAAAWQQAGLNLRVAVNLSARQFSQPGFPEQVRGVLNESGLAPHLLEIEITESSLMNNAEQAILHMATLSALGVEFALDDFGTGYSSLSYLQRLSLNRLKIDQSFVRDLGTNDANAIVTTIISLAHSLKMEVIAEGVETREQLDYLVALKCDEYQGYLFSHPIPADDIPAIATRR